MLVTSLPDRRARLAPVSLPATLLALLLALPAAGQEAADAQSPEPGGEQATEPEAASVPAQVNRRIPISRLGFDEGLALKGSTAEAGILFPLPRHVNLEQAGLALSFDHDMALSETASLRVDVEGVPRAAEEVRGTGRLDLPLPVNGSALRQEWLSLGLSYRATAGGDRCHDAMILPDFLVLRPESGLHFAVDAHQVETLEAAWALLPQRVTISLGREPLSPENFGALLEISRQLLASGRELRYLPLPEIPEEAPVGLLAAGLSGARTLLFNGSSEEESFAIGHLIVASDAELLAVEEAVEAAQSRFRRFSGAEAGEIPEPQTELQPNEEQRQPMRLVRFLDYPVIAAGGSDPEATAAVLARGWSASAGGAALDVATAQPYLLAEAHRDTLSLAELGFSRDRAGGSGVGNWSLYFSLGDLPERRLPTGVELEFILPERAQGETSDPLDVYLNDVLLATIPAGPSGSRRRETIAFPPDLLASHNELRIELRRTLLSDCKLPPTVGPARILGSSLIHIRDAAEPHDFLEMIAHMGSEPLFLLPQDLLRRAGEVMPSVARLANTLLPGAVRPEILFYEGRLPPVERPFLLLGHPEGGSPPQAPLTVTDDRLEVRSGDGGLVLEASAGNQAAVLQLARLDEQKGFWLLPDGEGRYPAARDLSLGQSDIAWLDDHGVALALQSDPVSARRSRWSWAEPWRALLEQNRQAILIGAGVLLTLIVILLLARARRDRRRKQARKARTGLES